MIDPRIPLALGDEVDQLRAEINEQARLLGISAEKELALRAENERLKVELAEARKDAERYRWLCDNSNDTEHIARYFEGVPADKFNPKYKEGIDKEIDAAMKG